MKTYHVLELSGFKQEHKQKLPAFVKCTYATPATVTLTQMQQVDIVIGRPPIELLKQSPNVKWLQLDTAGSEIYAKEEVLPKGCILTNATGSFGLAISEYLLCTILMLMRNMNLYIRNQEKGLWQVEGPISSIYGSTFLIVGLGDLGMEFAKKVKLLGGKSIGIKRHVDKELEYIDELYTLQDIEKLLPRADVVVLALPNTKETARCFHKEYFEFMKKSAIFVNVGRGNAVYTEDVLHAVKENEIAGAILDVCDVEPIPSSHPIWKEENIIITPHISGTFQLPETYERFVDIVIQNLHAYDRGEELRNVVDLSLGYRTYHK